MELIILTISYIAHTIICLSFGYVIGATIEHKKAKEKNTIYIVNKHDEEDNNK